MGELGIRKYGSIWWELGRSSENRNGYCENAHISFNSLLTQWEAGREVSQ